MNRKSSNHEQAPICAAFVEAMREERRAFGVRVEQIGNEMLEVVPSSAKASKGDFGELIEHVQAFIAEHSIEESI
jgi:hypothetical protein